MRGEGGGGFAGSQPMSTVCVHRSANKLSRSNSIFNLCVDDSSLNYASWPFETDWPYAGISYVGQLMRSSCANITLTYCVKSVWMTSRPVPWCVQGQDTSVRDATSKGGIVQGTRRPRDGSSKGCLVQGMPRPRDATSETSIVDTPVGDEITLYQNCPIPRTPSKCSTAIFDRDSEHLLNRERELESPRL
jgi:hypothetical protein